MSNDAIRAVLSRRLGPLLREKLSNNVATFGDVLAYLGADFL